MAEWVGTRRSGKIFGFPLEGFGLFTSLWPAGIRFPHVLCHDHGRHLLAAGMECPRT